MCEEGEMSVRSYPRAEMAEGHPANTVLVQGLAASNLLEESPKSLPRQAVSFVCLFHFQKYCKLEEEGSFPL